MNHYHEAAAILIARCFLGLLFFFQGYDSVFHIKIKNVITTYQDSFAYKGIPKIITAWACWFTALSALIGGVLLFFGLFEYCILYLLGFNLIIASVAFGIDTPMWDTKFVFPRLVLLLLLLLLPSSMNILSLDHLFFKH